MLKQRKENFQIFKLFNKKFSIKLQIFAFALLLLNAISCQKIEIQEIEKTVSTTSNERVEPKEPKSDVLTAKQLNFNYNEINENLEKFAISLAAEIREAEMRKLIKTESMKMFDGDYDILYKNFKNLKMKSGESVEEKLLSKNKEISSQSSKIPLFQISVPVGCEGWDTDNFAPLVAIAPQGIRETEVTIIKAYDVSGKLHYISAKESPKQPIIVVGMSERTDLEGNLLKGYGSPKKSPSNGRLDNSPEYLGRLYSTNPTAIESWWLGAWDLRLNVIISANGGQSAGRIVDNGLFSAGQECVQHQHGGGQNGCYFGDFLFTWLPQYGNIVNYNWIEDDGGGWIGEVQIQVNFNFFGQTATVNTTVPQKPFDTNIGTWPVWKGEPSGLYYGSSSVFSFQLFF